MFRRECTHTPVVLLCTCHIGIGDNEMRIRPRRDLRRGNQAINFTLVFFFFPFEESSRTTGYEAWIGRWNVLAPPRMEHSRPAPDAPPYRIMHPGALLIVSHGRKQVKSLGVVHCANFTVRSESQVVHCANFTVRSESHSCTLCQRHC